MRLHSVRCHLFGAVDATGYRVTNVILHTLNALLVLAIARAVAPGQVGFPVLAAALFAQSCPVMAEPISWISGRVDSLAALFYLGAFWSFIQFRRRQRVSWLLAALIIVFACGLFTKQSVLTFRYLILAFDLLPYPAHEQPDACANSLECRRMFLSSWCWPCTWRCAISFLATLFAKTRSTHPSCGSLPSDRSSTW